MLKMVPLNNSEKLREEFSEIETITVKKNKPETFFLSKMRDFCKIKCNVITTYFVDNVVFSQFTNPKSIKEVFPIVCYFFIPNTLQYNIEEICEKVNIEKLQLSEFIEGVNSLISNDKITEFYSDSYKRKRNKITYAVLCILLILVGIYLAIHFIY